MSIRLGAARRIEGLVGFGELSSQEAMLGRYRGSVRVLVVEGATPAETQRRPGVHGPHHGWVRGSERRPGVHAVVLLASGVLRSAAPP